MVLAVMIAVVVPVDVGLVVGVTHRAIDLRAGTVRGGWRGSAGDTTSLKLSLLETFRSIVILMLPGSEPSPLDSWPHRHCCNSCHFPRTLAGN